MPRQKYIGDVLVEPQMPTEKRLFTLPANWLRSPGCDGLLAAVSAPGISNQGVLGPLIGLRVTLCVTERAGNTHGGPSPFIITDSHSESVAWAGLGLHGGAVFPLPAEKLIRF